MAKNVMRTIFRIVYSVVLSSLLLCTLNSCDETLLLLTEIPEDTFWNTVDPDVENLDQEKIKALETLAQDAGNLFAFLVIRNGKIVSETYRNGANERTLLHLRSVTKHVTGLLAGMAIDQGMIAGTGADLAQYFAEMPPASGWNEVTLYHLLNMLSGMDWRETLDLSSYESHLDDPVPFIFSRDIIHTPGTVYEYCTPGSHLVSNWIGRVSGTTRGFAEDHLWNPLGVKGYRWEEDGQNVVRGGTGLELTARDLAKIGLLYLQRGNWDGRQLVTEDWIEDGWEHPIMAADVGGFDRPASGYRNYWWTSDIGNIRVHFSDGYGGQLLLVAPAYNIIVVTNSFHLVSPQASLGNFRYIFNRLLPAVFDSILD